MRLLFSPLQIALASLCGLLALVLVYELNASPPIYTVPTFTPRTVGFDWGIAPPHPSAPDIYSNINGRPIFNPARKPVVATVKTASGTGATAAAPATPEASLVGIIIDGKRRIALIRTPGSPMEVSLEVGGMVGDWMVSNIEPDRVVLKSGTSEHEISLNANRVPGADGGMPDRASADMPAEAPVTPPPSTPTPDKTP